MTKHTLVVALVLACFPIAARAQVPQLINYQGRVAVGGTNFDGPGQFKFALVNGGGTTTYWSNDGTGTAGGPPASAVTLPVSKGLYSVLLGDVTLAHMTAAIPASVFANSDVRLRVWFNDGTHGFQPLTPDQRIAAVGYAMMAGGVNLPVTTSASNGLLEIGGTPFLHAYGSNGLFDGNTFVGSAAGNFTMSGWSNTANGMQALQQNTTGNYNTASGVNALQHNTTGYWNTASGVNALTLNTTGYWNTAIGTQALQQNTTGINNIGMGNCGGMNLTTGSNNIDIGNSGVAGESNVIRIGDGTTQTHTYLTGTIHGNSATQDPGGPLLLEAADTSYLRLNPSLPGGAWNGIVQPGDQGLIFEGAGGMGSGSFVIASHASATSGIRIDATGNVGIGKAIPATALDVSGTVTATAFSGNGSGLTGISATALTGSITGDQIAAGSITGADIATGAVGRAQLASGVVPPAVTVTGPAVTATVNTVYNATGASPTTFTLPTTSNVGAVVQVNGIGAGGWSVTTGTGQSLLGTWTLQTSGIPTSANWTSIASSADGTHLAAAASGDATAGGGIYTSANSGNTWTTAREPNYWTSIASSADGTHLAAAYYIGPGGIDESDIVTSINSGLDWVAAFPPRPHEGVCWQCIASSADGTHLAAVIDGGWISTSTDSGTTWMLRTSGLPASANWWSITSSADGSRLAAVVMNGGLYTSADSGMTWTLRTGAPSYNTPWRSIASSADGTHLAAVYDGGQIFTSTSSGANWTAQAGSPITSWSSIASSADGSHLAAAVNGGGIYTSTDFGVTWTLQTGAPTNGLWTAIACSADGSRLAAATFDGGIYTSPSTVSGSQGSSQRFQYVGNGVWQPVQANGNWLVSGNNLYYNAGNVGIGTSWPLYPLTMGSGAYCSLAGQWTSSSDRNVKEDFTAIAPGDVLAKVAALPITQWKYKVEPTGIKHIGPVAQDFHAAFGLGDNDRAIGSVDETGVALAAIQGLNQKLEEQRAQNAGKLEAQNAKLKEKDAEIQELKRRLEKLEQAVSGTPASHPHPARTNDQPTTLMDGTSK